MCGLYVGVKEEKGNKRPGTKVSGPSAGLPPSHLLGDRIGLARCGLSPLLI